MTGAALEEVVESLRKSRVRRTLPRESLRRFLSFVERVEFPAGHTLIREGELGRDMYLIIEGTAQAERGRVLMNPMGPGAEFGSLGLLTDRPRAATVTALSKISAVKLAHAAWEQLAASEPAIALSVAQALFNQVRDDLMHLTDSVGALLQGRSLPRAAEVQVRWGDEVLRVPTGTPLTSLLPREVGGHLVVGALLGQKPVSLATPVPRLPCALRRSSATAGRSVVRPARRSARRCGWRFYQKVTDLYALSADYDANAPDTRSSVDGSRAWTSRVSHVRPTR